MDVEKLVVIVAFFATPVLTLLFVAVFLHFVVDMGVNAVAVRFGVRQWVLRSVLFVVCVAAFLGYVTHDRIVDERMRRESYAKAQALKDEIDARFREGAPQENVVSYLEPKLSGQVWGGLEGHDFVVFVGREPGEALSLCGPYAVGVRAEFVEERLRRTMVIGRIADLCP